MTKVLGFILIFFVYISAFFYQEQQNQYLSPQLSQTLPVNVHRIAAGYMVQLWAEMIYIKTIVFLGGRKPGLDPQSYADYLAEHFSVIASLHPGFIDTYFLCESSLSSLGPEYTRKTNAVLVKGIIEKPDNWILPFFKAFNHFRYLDEPVEAAEILYKTAQLSGAPDWFGHLASLLSAKGGNIVTGLIWLKAMLATEKDEAVQERYKQEIVIFENAARVQQAIQKYHEVFNHPPADLSDLVPGIIPELPKIEGGFSLSWNPPVLSLIRPKSKL